MNKTFLITSLILVFSIFFLFGCTESNLNICGDGICTVGEENTCPTDCAEPVNATVNINVSGAWDATGDLSLYWYHSKDVYANASANITSRLGENWFGEQAQNLNISFNDSESGSKPVGDNRNIQMNFTQPGDYYFELRSEDYAYRAVSEKITVSESKEYYVDLQIVPSNPALRVKAVNNNYDIINGPGKIDLYMKRNYYQYGENKEDEFLYDSISFEKGQEINALFFVYVQRNKLENEYIEYKVVVSVDGYESQEYYYAPYSKYQEIYARFNDVVEEKTGDLKVSIVPGVGTTQDDLLELDESSVQACGSNGCYYTTVNGESIYFADLPQDTYYVTSAYENYEAQSSNPPMSVAELKVNVDSDVVYGETKGLRGFGLKISLLDSSGNLIDTANEELYGRQSCMVDGDIEECSEINDPPQKLYIAYNPIEINSRAYSEEQIIGVADDSFKMELMYNGQAKWFSYSMKQGYNEFIWQFDPVSVDHNYVEDVEVGNSIYVDGGIDYNGQILEIQLMDVLQNATSVEYNGKFGLYSNGTLIEVIQAAPVFDLKDQFGDSKIATSAVVESVGLRLEDNAYVATIRVE